MINWTHFTPGAALLGGVLIGLGSALLSLIVFGKDQLILPAMGLILACLLSARKRDIGRMEGPRA